MGENPLNRKGRTIYETKKYKEEYYIFNKEQLIKTTWNNFTKKYYTGLGYQFTKIGDEFFVKAKDLKQNAMVYITGICDYCGQEKQILMRDYTRSTKNQTVPFTCGNNLCTQKKLNDMYGKERKQEQIQYYYDFCKKNNYTPLSNVDDYVNARTKLKYICPIHGEQQICVNDIKIGHACQQCGYIKSKTKNMLTVEEVIKIIEDKNNTVLNPQDYRNASTKNLLIKCGDCGKIRKASLSSIMNSKGHCPECGAKYLGRQMALSPTEVEKRINSVNGNKLLNPEDYKSVGVKNLKIRCSCGNIFTVSLGNYMWGTPNRCRFCSQKTSKGELKILTKLEDMGIKYEQEKCFSDCKDKRCLPFDFYLPDHNTIIEFDGQHHYFPTHSMCTYQYTIKHDKMKNEYCKQNHINLIRIPYWEYQNIDQILEEKFSKNKQVS